VSGFEVFSPWAESNPVSNIYDISDEWMFTFPRVSYHISSETSAIFCVPLPAHEASPDYFLDIADIIMYVTHWGRAIGFAVQLSTCGPEALYFVPIVNAIGRREDEPTR
jgi:hypothetical protein